MQRPPGVLIFVKGKIYPFWYPCRENEVKQVLAAHLTHYSRERSAADAKNKSNPFSEIYAEQVGLAKDSPSALVAAKLAEQGHIEEAAAVRTHNFGETRIIGLDEYIVFWVKRFKFVKDRANPDVAEPDLADTIDLVKLFG